MERCVEGMVMFIDRIVISSVVADQEPTSSSITGVWGTEVQHIGMKNSCITRLQLKETFCVVGVLAQVYVFC